MMIQPDRAAVLREMRIDIDRCLDDMRTEFSIAIGRLDAKPDDEAGAPGSLTGHRAMVERTVSSFEFELLDLKRRVAALEAQP